MKAKHFAKLRKQLKRFQVQETNGLFGFDYWGEPFNSYVEVLAKNPIQAAQRARRRGYGIEHQYPDDYTTQRWARFRVKLSDKSNHWKNIYYIY